MNSTTQMLENNYKKSDLNNKENKVKGLYTIYNMNLTVQIIIIIIIIDTLYLQACQTHTNYKFNN